MSELITLVDLLQPICSRSYGSNPCTASIGVTGALKCYNTRATCQDPENYETTDLVLRFCEDQDGVQGYGYVIPSLRGISITPLMVNLAGMDAGSSPFGQRETVSIQFDDHLHSDLLVDPYRLERPIGTAGTIVEDTYNTGTFWGKWLSRNPYNEGFHIRVHQGLVGQSIEEMETRHYIIDRINGPADGRLSITAKDLFSKVESRKSVAPKASRGELRTGFDEIHAGDIEIIPAEVADADYDISEFYVAINDEILLVEREEGSATLSIVTRGALGTQPEEHDGGDKVQLVLRYSSERAQAIVSDLLQGYAGIGSQYIPISEWNAEMASRPDLLSAYIAEPTPVEKLVGELCEQVGFSLWPDVIENKIKLSVLSPDNNPLPIVTDEDWILEGSYSSRRMIEQRVSQVWVYYGQRNPLENQTDPVNYRARRVFADPSAEAADQYGSPAIREVFSRWIPALAGAIASRTADRILSLFRDPPLRISFEIHRTREGELNIGTQFSVQTRDEQSTTGKNESKTFTPIQLSRTAERIRVTAQQISFFYGEPETRVIEIDDNTNNYNMRNIYELLYGTPPAGEVVTFRVLSGAKVGSDNPNTPAVTTGDWPTNVELRLEIQAGAVISGAGGNGGTPGQDGANGGTGLFVAAPLFIDNFGTIAGGGGGGGGALDEMGGMSVQADGGGGAGIDPGTGNEPGTETTGGEGGYQEDFGPGVEPTYIYAQGGNGGDLGQPGDDGSSSFIVTSGGAAGAAIDGTGLVFFDNVGTIIGSQLYEEDTVFFPAAVAPENLNLSKELVLISTGAYATLLAFTFDIPEDSRIITFEAQYQLARDGNAWRPLFNAYKNRHEWNTAEIGTFRVRVRSVYIRNRIYSAWVTAEIVSLGTFDQLATIGISDPIDPLLFITFNPDRPTAQIRISAGFEEDGISATPDRLLMFYSAQDRAAQMRIATDAGDKLYLDLSFGVANLFNFTVGNGSTDSLINFVAPPGTDIDLYSYWWASVRNEPGAPSRYYKIVQSTTTTLKLPAGENLPFIPAPGQLIDMAEIEWSDSRLPEFRLLYVDGEVIRHGGINYDGQYYVEVAERGVEGTTQANQSGKVFDYYPAPGALTNIVDIPASNFLRVDGRYEYSGEINVNMPVPLVWGAVTVCFARQASEGSNVQFIRSNIVPLTIAGPV